MNYFLTYRKIAISLEIVSLFILGLIAFHESEIIYIMFALVMLAFIITELQFINLVLQHSKYHEHNKDLP